MFGGAAAALPFVAHAGDFCPTAAEQVGGELGAAVPGEGAFAVAADPHRALDGCKIGKVPDQFPNEEGAFVKLGSHPRIVFGLVFLTEHTGAGIVQAVDGVGAILGKQDGLALAGPEIEFFVERCAGCVKVARKVVPPVIPVQANDIHRAGGNIPGIVVLAADKGDRAVLRVKGMGLLIQRAPVLVSRTYSKERSDGTPPVGRIPHGRFVIFLL